MNSHKKRLNAKLAGELLQTILKERENVREDADGFIRYNGQKKGFEFFHGKGR